MKVDKFFGYFVLSNLAVAGLMLVQSPAGAVNAIDNSVSQPKPSQRILIAADPRDFDIHNKSSLDIDEIYVTDSDEEDWGDDILEEDILEAGDTAEVTFTDDDDEKSCSYDIKAVAENGKFLEIYDVNLCNTTSITFQDSDAP